MTRNVLAVAWKDLQVLFKDRGALMVLFLMPLLFATVFGGAAAAVDSDGEGSPDSEDALAITCYLVNEDPGPYGAQVVDALSGIGMLDTEQLTSADLADQKVADGEEPAAIIIPADFSQKIDAAEPTSIRIIRDPTQQEAAKIVAGIVNSVVAEIGVLAEIRYGISAVLDDSGALEGADPEMRRAIEAQTLGVVWTQVEEMRRNPIISVKSQDLEGAETGAPWNPYSFLMPSFATMFAFFLVGFVATNLLVEKEQGSFRRLLASPIRPGSIIAGKMLAYGLVVFLQVLLLFTVGSVLFGMPLGDSPAGLLLLTLVVALTATSLGMLVGAFARTSKQAETIGIVLGMVLMVAGGCIAMGQLAFRSEGFTYYLSKATPHGHAIDAYMKLLAEGAGLVDVLPEIGAIAAMGALFMLIATWRFKYE